MGFVFLLGPITSPPVSQIFFVVNLQPLSQPLILADLFPFPFPPMYCCSSHLFPFLLNLCLPILCRPCCSLSYIEYVLQSLCIRLTKLCSSHSFSSSFTRNSISFHDVVYLDSLSILPWQLEHMLTHIIDRLSQFLLFVCLSSKQGLIFLFSVF